MLVIKLFYNLDLMILLAYMVYFMYMSTHVTITIIDKTLSYKSIITKVSHRSLPESLLYNSTYEFVIHQNLPLILSFIIDVLQFFGIDLLYLISSWHEDFIQSTITIFCPTY